MSKKVMSAVTMRRPNRSQPGHHVHSEPTEANHNLTRKRTGAGEVLPQYLHT